VVVDPGSRFVELGSIRQRGGKVVHAGRSKGITAVPVRFHQHLEMEWPPHSGKRRSFPEVDRLQFYSLADARVKIKDTHVPFLDRLAAHLKQA